MTDSLRKSHLGNVSIGTNDNQRGLTPKLASAGDDPDERYYMLAAYCFDLSRKMKYISLALKDFYWEGDPSFIKEIRDDERYINPDEKNLSWKEMAHRAEEVMKRLYGECHQAGYHDARKALAEQAERELAAEPPTQDADRAEIEELVGHS
jgi:hypothetical protein